MAFEQLLWVSLPCVGHGLEVWNPMRTILSRNCILLRSFITSLSFFHFFFGGALSDLDAGSSPLIDCLTVHLRPG